MVKRIWLALVLAAALCLAPAGAQAGYIGFSDLLGTGFSAPGGSAGSYGLDSYGLSGYSMDFHGYSWYGASDWLPGQDPGAGDAAGLFMIEYRGEHGLAVGDRAGTGSLSGLPATGVNEMDAREGLGLAFNKPVTLHSITLGNFYNDRSQSDPALETGWLVLDGAYAVPLEFIAPLAQVVSNGSDPGTFVFSLPTPVNVTSVMLFAGDRLTGASWSSDYLVRGVSAQAGTPEPASLLLFGSAAGAAGLIRLRRRRRG
jgi:hypothetical protein